MRTEQIIAALEAVDGVLIKPAKDGAVLQLGLQGDRVTAKLAETGRRIGDVKSPELLRHLRHGGEARGRLDKSLTGAMVVCTLVARH
ncbi:hypothetical protein ACL598_17665 [Bordetella bronchialis]|uniref:hypothetical protein n=1 Tax=Bordetella bronchialis TaxID=463025 RepID=UPI003D090682